MAKNESLRVKRIVYREILPGDRRKSTATSANANTGGGARDLRFRNYDRFRPVFAKMFPHINEKGIAVGRFYWHEGEKEVSSNAFFHPPTNARPKEGRIANIDKFLPIEKIPAEEEGTSFVLLIQDSDGKVWPSFATEKALNTEWHEDVRDVILGCHNSKKRSTWATSGYVDFEYGGGGFCNHD
ncbi:hypothetical protein [Planococcus halotolerans]|uniref:hypothetical protein n=1 Tax=Planococcus halotolerans TaxID=2233542 RepID=UPI001092221D|nr:hypothetical protein [Planococcus halotolerans]QHJ69220.1 hypothetical protein DNR44_000550 [Planococcus halotolerans]